MGAPRLHTHLVGAQLLKEASEPIRDGRCTCQRREWTCPPLQAGQGQYEARLQGATGLPVACGGGTQTSQLGHPRQALRPFFAQLGHRDVS